MIQELSRAAIIPHNFGEHTTYLGTKQLQGIQHGWMLKEPAESLRLKWTGKKNAIITLHSCISLQYAFLHVSSSNICPALFNRPEEKK